jgi:hypothetical protein
MGRRLSKMDRNDGLWALTVKDKYVSGDMTLNEIRNQRRDYPRGAIPVPSRYRAASLEESRAQDIAHDWLVQEIKKLSPDLTFQPVRLRTTDPMRFSFIAICDQWRDAGRIPGGLTCSVDRVDGHVWTFDEMELYAARVNED